MNYILIILIFCVLLIDFAKLKKKSKKTMFIYILITIMILVVGIVDKYDFFADSPFDIWIEKMAPPPN